MKDAQFQEQAEDFDKCLVCLYNGQSEEGLDSSRYLRFCRKITTGTSFVQSKCLPPSSAAAIYHRVCHQVQQWRGVALPPQDWGWKLVDGRFLPIRTDLPAAHTSLLEIVRCNCKSDCGSQRCSYRKHGLDCSAACGNYRGEGCPILSTRFYWKKIQVLFGE